VIRAHVAAFQALLTADPNGLTVYVGESPNLTAGAYVTLYPDAGNRQAVDLADANPLQVWTIQTTCNGETVEQANWLMEKVEARLEGIRPVVAGRTCTRVKKLFSVKAQRDDDVDPARFYAVADWRWTSNPNT